MAVAAADRQHSDKISRISSNSRLFLCGSEDGDATLWKRSTHEGKTILKLFKRIEKPFEGKKVHSCSMNESHLALVGIV